MLLLFPQEGRMEDGVYVLGGTTGRVDALVVAKGSRVSDRIREGSTVFCEQSAGIIFTLDGVRYRIVPESEIMAEASQYGEEGE